MSVLLYESKDQIATITINRPDKRNALSEEVCVKLREAWQRFSSGDDRVAIITGAGDLAFSGGADLADLPKAFWQCVPGIGVQVEKPVIAALSGWCVGGGVVLAMMADLAIASKTTRLLYPEAKVGIFGGVMAGLVSRMPHKVAMEFMLMGEELSVQRAYEVGFDNRIVEPGKQIVVAREYAGKIAANAPLVLQTIKRFALATVPQGPAERFYPDVGRLAAIMASADKDEGVAAFRGKRKPKFSGR
ncbi:MAG TPA: enoyl-CoA hydratase-related protein [Burkholderiales bacterium]